MLLKQLHKLLLKVQPRLQRTHKPKQLQYKQPERLTLLKLRHQLLLHQYKPLKVQLRLQQQIHKRKLFQYKQALRLMQPKPLHKLLLHKCKLLKVQPRLQQIHKPKLFRHKLA